jgi:pectate lyase
MAPSCVPYHEEACMNKLLIGLATVPLMSGVAFAAQSLTDRQMDAVTAGFASTASSEAESFGGVTTATTANLAEVAALRTNAGALVTVTVGEVTLNIIKAVSASQSTSTAANLPSLQPIAVVTP